MSASVVSGSSIKAHRNQRDTSHMTASRSSSVSPDMDDDDSIMDFEEELQQELENEMSASIDNLFGDELDDASDLFGDSRSATGTSAVGDRAVTEFSDDDDEDEDDEDDEDDPVLESDDDDDDDNGVDADLFGDGSAADSDDDDDFDIDFEDPPVNPNAVSSHPSANDTNTLIDDDSASDDEFEAVEFDFEAIQTGLEGPSFNTAAHTVPNRESSASILQRKRARTRVHIGDTYMLERYKDEQPSLTLHLFDSHFRFEGQEGVFLYNGPMRFFFQALNEGKIPIDLVDVLMQVNCRYYEGCLIVEVRDHRRPTLEPKTKKQRVTELLTSSLFGGVPNFNSLRPAAQTHSPTSLPAHVVPEPGSIATQNCQPTIVSGTTADCPQDADGAKVYKKVMRPTSETVNLDIQLACERSRTKLSQNDVLEMEGMILLAVEEPLDLEPDFQVSRVSNAIRYIEYEHLLPRKRRKFNSAEIEAEKAEREEKLKLLTLMDDRKTREFQPSFNRVSQVNDWRHKKYVNDAEVYPAAVPVAPTGKKASNKKNRSQVSLLADGRKVIRTLRFVQTINGRSTHTVFHVAELPDGKGLQGIMRWGTLPDTSINGGSKMFSFPNEDIMRMHIDNFKLLLSIENNRLIYDSVYPNGIPTADPPPDSTASPSIPQNHPSTSTNMSVAVPDSTAVSPTIESEAPSPVVTTTNTLASTLPVSPVVAKAELPKAKESVAKNSARGSRKNSPQPKGRKVGNRASASASVEPEVETVKAKPAAGVQRATKETGQKGKATAKKSSAVSDRGSPAPELPIQNKVPEPVADAMPIPEPVLIKEALPAPAKPVSARSKSATKLKTAAAAAAALVPEPEPEPEPVPAPAPAQTEERPADPVTVAETNALAAKEKKGAKGTRKTPAPKEKKPRAKPKTAAAKGASNPAAALQPDAEAVQSPTASQPLIPTSAGAAVGINNLTRVNTNAAAEDEATLSQKPEMSGSAPMANGAGAYLLLSPSMLHATGTPLPVSASAAAAVGPPTMQSPPGLQSPAPGGLPMQMAQIAMAQLNARLTSMAQANGGLRMELPEFLTKEYLHANPQYTTMLRNEIARMAVQQRMQQQGIQNAGNLGPMGSPHVRTGISPNMAAAAAQMVQATQNNAGVATGAGASPAPVANLGTPVQAPNANPMLTSPNVRPATLNGNAALLQQQQQQQQQQRQQMQQLQHLQQLQATPEEMLLVQQYCRLFGLQILGAQDPRLIVLVAKAKSGELRSLIMTRMQGLNAQQQQQQMAAGAGQIRPNGLVNIGMPHQPQPMQANASAQNSPVPANSLPPGAAITAGQTPAMANMQLPPDLANMSQQDKARLIEIMVQRQRAINQNAAAGQVQNPGPPLNQQAVVNLFQQQQQQQQQLQQQQRNMAMAASGNMAVQSSAAVSMQSPMALPSQPGGVATQAHQAPMSALMGSPTPAPANAPGLLSAGQQLLLQQATLANMTPQHRQELLQRMQQMQQQHQQQQAAAPRPPQINTAMLLQQITSGQINPTLLPLQVIIYLLQNAQSQLTAEHRQLLHRVLEHHARMQQSNNAAGPVQPGQAQ